MGKVGRPYSDLYERDFYAWANEQATLLRTGRLSLADIENIAEELESMGRTEKRELVSRLAVLLLHLLKWQYQPSRRGPSWEATIRNQRLDVVDHLADNSSLKVLLTESLTKAYERAKNGAAGETDLSKRIFPTECPWTFDKIVNAEFWPE